MLSARSALASRDFGAHSWGVRPTAADRRVGAEDDGPPFLSSAPSKQKRWQSDATITGRVTSEAGQPLQSVSVFISALNTGTLTRADGMYMLIVPAWSAPGGADGADNCADPGTRVAVAAGEPHPRRDGDAELPAHPRRAAAGSGGGTGVETATTRQRLGVSTTSVTSEEINCVPRTNVVEALAAAVKFSYLVRENLSHIESTLDSAKFCRIHRSAIVNIDRIQAVESILGGEYLVVLHDGTKPTSGRSYRRNLHVLMGKES
jgi:hypothetical protein